jgi:hypothetical protein
MNDMMGKVGMWCIAAGMQGKVGVGFAMDGIVGNAGEVGSTCSVARSSQQSYVLEGGAGRDRCRTVEEEYEGYS